MTQYKILDNALPTEIFEQVKNCILFDCDWYFNDTITTEEDKQFPISYFVHSFYEIYDTYDIKISHAYPAVKPILDVLSPKSIRRIKGNQYVNQNLFVEHGLHTDSDDKNMKAAIFYVNTNNGYTIFEDGEKIESVENRLLIFDSNIPHKSTNCTDELRRITLNFNYY